MIANIRSFLFFLPHHNPRPRMQDDVFTFNSFGRSVLTMFFLLFMDGWSEWAKTLAEKTSPAALLFPGAFTFFVTVMLIQFILVYILEDLREGEQRETEKRMHDILSQIGRYHAQLERNSQLSARAAAAAAGKGRSGSSGGSGADVWRHNPSPRSTADVSDDEDSDDNQGKREQEMVNLCREVSLNLLVAIEEDFLRKRTRDPQELEIEEQGQGENAAEQEEEEADCEVATASNKVAEAFAKPDADAKSGANDVPVHLNSPAAGVSEQYSSSSASKPDPAATSAQDGESSKAMNAHAIESTQDRGEEPDGAGEFKTAAEEAQRARPNPPLLRRMAVQSSIAARLAIFTYEQLPMLTCCCLRRAGYLRRKVGELFEATWWNVVVGVVILGTGFVLVCACSAAVGHSCAPIETCVFACIWEVVLNVPFWLLVLLVAALLLAAPLRIS